MGDVTKLTPKQVQCEYCPESHPWQQCPRIASIDYYPDQARMRVEFQPDPVFEFFLDDDDDTPEDE